MPPLEKEVIKILLDGINSTPGCKAIKIHNAGYMESGTPDIIGCVHGEFLCIEAKRDEKKKLTPIQEQRIGEWSAASGTCAVIKGVDQAKEFVIALKKIGAAPTSRSLPKELLN